MITSKDNVGVEKNNDVWIVSEKEKAAKSQEKRKVWHSRLDVIDNIALLHHVKPAFKNKPNIKGHLRWKKAVTMLVTSLPLRFITDDSQSQTTVSLATTGLAASKTPWVKLENPIGAG